MPVTATHRRGVSRLARLLVSLTVGVAGCATPHLDDTLPVQDAPPFSQSGDVALADRWWHAFEDPGLEAQIDLAIETSFPLDAAWERVLAARILTWQRSTDLLPDLNGIVQGNARFRPGSDPSSFGFGLSGSYEPDLWGRIGWRTEAQRLRALGSHADYQTTALTLSSEIAATWFQLIEANAQLALVEQQIETNRQGVTLIERRFGFGKNRSADVLRQRQLVESTREQAVVIHSRIELLEHRLALLQGLPPQQMTYDVGINLPELPPLPDTGLPSDLLLRRPDVRRDYLALLSADREVASAVSAQYPRLNLTASLTTAAENPESLFRDWIASIAGQLVAPLFDAGQRRSEVHRTAAVTRQRLSEYGQTILTAFREVEDALAREKFANQRIAVIESQIELAEQTTVQLREQYLNAGTDYLSVLTATREQQRLQRAYLSTRLERVLARVALYRALAGSFINRPVQAPTTLQPIADDLAR